MLCGVCGGVHALYNTLCPAVLLHIPSPAVYHSTQHHSARTLESSLYVLSHSPYGIILIAVSSTSSKIKPDIFHSQNHCHVKTDKPRFLGVQPTLRAYDTDRLACTHLL